MKQILRMAFWSTSGMTLFSFILSVVFKRKFLETELLNQLVFYNRKQERKNHPLGFILHYSVGLFFSSIFYATWKNTSLQPDYKTGTCMGLANGLAGISVWHLFFVLHDNPPKVNLKGYYLQLLVAHMVFGALNSLLFRKRMPAVAMKE